MAKAVFTTKVDPAYDDLPAYRYHFPKTYLRQVEATIGDWIIYYEPRRGSAELSSRGGRQSYFATARVTRVQPDPTIVDHFYAFMEDFLEFSRAVPFKVADHYYEGSLRRADGATSKGAFGRAVRLIPDHEYDLILKAGFAEIVGAERVSAGLPGVGFADEQEIFQRPLVERITSRPFRDAAFAAAVKSAYSDRCSVTGLRIINGGGRSEVQAAHIRPVASSGPDSIRNGLALSGTIHWMFDRGLISFGDDHAILLAAGRVPPEVERLINPERRLLPPLRPDLAPHPQFLRFHRETVFKG